MHVRKIIKMIPLGLAVFLIAAGPAQAGLINGGFETGDLTGWTSGPGSVTVFTSVAKIGESGNWNSTEGDHFVRLLSGVGIGAYTLLSQEFDASAGDQLTLDAFFDAGDGLPFNDDGFVRLMNSSDNSLVETLYSNSVAQVGFFGSSGWDSLSYTFTAGGKFRIEAGVRNILDNQLPSAIGLDNLVHSSPNAVPEPTSLTLLGIGAAGMAFGAYRRRRQKQVA